MILTRRRGAQIVAALGVTGAMGAACALPAASPPPRDVGLTASAPDGAGLVIDFDESPGSGSMVSAPRNSGRTPTSSRVTTLSGGRVVAVTGLDGLAARFPAIGGQGQPGAAVVVVPAGRDGLVPGTRDFTYGADVLLDEKNEGPSDNGDNVVQRGLYLDASQFKLQVDHRVPACRVAGESGVAFVEADLTLLAGRWYRLRCTRIGSELSLDVSAWNGTAWADRTTWSSVAETGVVAFETSEDGDVVPVSVGTKVDQYGHIPTSAGDQLNGVLDNVFIDISEVES